MAAISEGEVAVYDRQLRLWGVQAQQRLLQSSVLVWGLDGTNVEVCKDLVLAGLSLVVRDHRDVAVADVEFDYFLRREDLGRNRAASAAPRIQEMNPLCRVTASTAALEEIQDASKLREALKGHSVVCASLAVLGWDVGRACAIDAACRDVKAAFILTLSCGEIAFFFSNLHDHIVEERSSGQGGAPGTTPEHRPPGPETVHFPSLAEWLEPTPGELQGQKVDASVVFVALVLAFLRAQGSHKGSAAAAAEFVEYCGATAKCLPSVDGIVELQDLFSFLFIEPLMHVASILGGLVAQEVIKAVTKRDPPLVNCVCFNAHTNVALVELIPSAQSKPKKRKVEEAVADILD